MIINTIGFAGKSAEEFFTLLVSNNVKCLIDIRLNNKSQLAGFANSKHIPYFLKLHNIDYIYKPEYAPNKELLDDYKKRRINWQQYEKRYYQILKHRDVLNNIDWSIFDNSVLLCSEPNAEMCHRRLFAEMLANKNEKILIRHL
ncbi:MAG: DUF488 domain-containing protein [Candidatus Delongbacteria bacterium]|nr:DUF488 domain-containing protein [Candidatus Delongbacteria bacterium]